MVPGEGLEPTRPIGQRILSPPRLPIPPSRHGLTCLNTQARVATISKIQRSVVRLIDRPSVLNEMFPLSAVISKIAPIRTKVATTSG